MTDRFVVTAQAIAELNGLPDYPFAVIAHPIANNGDAELRTKAEEAVEQCIAILTRRAVDAAAREPVEAR